jgi:hypothetical protein
LITMAIHAKNIQLLGFVSFLAGPLNINQLVQLDRKTNN